jgi:branched-subunit amino acid ABC-type transport system permease component
MSPEAVLTQLLMGLTVGMNLVLVATGLTLVFGMLGVINSPTAPSSCWARTAAS